MSEFQIKVRKIKSGEALVASVESFEDALKFVAERPDFMEVVSVLSDASASQHRQLKEAMRPYSEEEQKIRKRLEEEHIEAVKAALEKDKRRTALDQEKARREGEAADPDRPMSIVWDALDGYSNGDAFDPREISDVVKDAVAAWVAERNTWVESRGQLVGEARVMVYPGPVPQGQERVMEGGRFTPRLKE